MEPLDTDLNYLPLGEDRPSSSASRTGILLIFPIIGFLMLLGLIGAALLQWNISDLVPALMGTLIVLFFAIIAGLFWALAPREKQA